ncbi:MAG: hypothetical protein LC647_13810 [Beggiatoa sp.]|nr:hypothetical protein [Beggiatoa sp.]
MPLDGPRYALANRRDRSTRVRIGGGRVGLSFADRSCRATGKLSKAIVLTADGAWLALDISVEIRAVC